jgi:hypothetical protein
MKAGRKKTIPQRGRNLYEGTVEGEREGRGRIMQNLGDHVIISRVNPKKYNRKPMKDFWQRNDIKLSGVCNVEKD